MSGHYDCQKCQHNIDNFSRIVIWRCSLNVFVIVIIIVFVFLLVISCFLTPFKCLRCVCVSRIELSSDCVWTLSSGQLKDIQTGINNAELLTDDICWNLISQLNKETNCFNPGLFKRERKFERRNSKTSKWIPFPDGV